MSDRHTPETDALAEKLIPIAEKITEFNAQSIIKQLLTEILTKTTKLERERDEARADLEFRRELYKVLEDANNHLMAANEEAVKLARTLKQERDEAREALLKIEEIYIDSDNTYDDWKAMGDVARKAVERWI